jgi:hypothetical protein
MQSELNKKGLGHKRLPGYFRGNCGKTTRFFSPKAFARNIISLLLHSVSGDRQHSRLDHRDDYGYTHDAIGAVWILGGICAALIS